MRAKKRSSIQQLGTERRNRAAAALDTMSALSIARLINREDSTVPRAVSRALPQIAKAIEVIVSQLAKGGRMIYVGAGTSGRIAALDASELPPTFNTDPKTVQYVIAGGDAALSAAAEYNKDSEGGTSPANTPARKMSLSVSPPADARHTHSPLCATPRKKAPRRLP
jgi:N-acetylmuramic acid 6-phosphate etherase